MYRSIFMCEIYMQNKSAAIFLHATGAMEQKYKCIFKNSCIIALTQSI